MLRASYTYRRKASRRGTGAGAHVTEREMPREVGELLDVVERFHEMGSDVEGRFPGGSDGDHAWVSVVDGGFIVHAYFCRKTIRFELYAPPAVGREKKHGDPYDGSGLSGEVDVQTLKEVLRLLDRGQSPREFIRENAKRCSVVKD
jgi:hypothetical protein